MPLFNLEYMQRKTAWAIHHAVSAATAVTHYRTDSQRAQRMSLRLCPCCYYFRRGALAGQAFTLYRCIACDQDFQHPNTAVPKLCTDCAEAFYACRMCGADRDLAKREMLSPALRDGVTKPDPNDESMFDLENKP